MTLEIITTLEGLRALQPAWETLWRSTDDTTPFQSPSWLIPWWNAFGSGDLNVIAGRNDRGLYALAPLCILRDEESDDTLGLLLGTGVSDYRDVISGADHGQALLTELTAARCDNWDLQQLPPTSALLSSRPGPGWVDSVEDHDSCPRLALGAATDSSESLLSAHSRKKLRYARRSLERLGDVSIDAATAPTLAGSMSALFELHAAKWRMRGLPGVLSDAPTQSFHREVAQRMFDGNLLRLFALRVRNKVIAVLYGFADRTTFYYYLSGYDPDLSRYSPGNILIAHAIDDAIRAGIKTFDFLRGAESYKYRWGARDRINRRRTLTRE